MFKILILLFLSLLIVSFMSYTKQDIVISPNLSNITNIESIIEQPIYIQNSSQNYIQNWSIDDYGFTIKEKQLYPVTIANTTSMVPTIMPQQTVLVSDDISKIKVGNIIIYKYNDTTFYIHRIIQINETYFTPKGDNNNRDDGIYPIETIRSVVYAVLY